MADSKADIFTDKGDAGQRCLCRDRSGLPPGRATIIGKHDMAELAHRDQPVACIGRIEKKRLCCKVGGHCIFRRAFGVILSRGRQRERPEGKRQRANDGERQKLKALRPARNDGKKRRRHETKLLHSGIFAAAACRVRRPEHPGAGRRSPCFAVFYNGFSLL